ncbi:MAG: hypothetical protein RIS85_357 [Pseudomonadota bacterium]|jgi:chromosome partitioning protein
MSDNATPQSAGFRRNVFLDGEHPDVIAADVLGRPRPAGRIIAIANEKGGVGKSTLAFHLCVALADAGLKVAAIDLDRRQQTLSQAMHSREASARRLEADLPQIRHMLVHVHSGAMLCQELCRIGQHADVLVIDVPGYDSPIARRAITLADTLLTPVNGSFLDLSLLGRFDPVSLSIVGDGCFALAVKELRQARQRQGSEDIDWLVVPNRIGKNTGPGDSKAKAALRQLAERADFRVAHTVAERAAFRDLFFLGLTHLDIRCVSQLGQANAQAVKEIQTLVADLSLGPKAKGAGPEPETPLDLSIFQHVAPDG